MVESVIPNPKLKLLDQIREVMRLKHYSIRTEQSYTDWVRRYIHFHQMRTREEMLPAEPFKGSPISSLLKYETRRVRREGASNGARGRARSP